MSQVASRTGDRHAVAAAPREQVGAADRNLVVRAQRGDQDAFSELAARSIGRLTTAARLILHDEQRAQDAVQDALVDAWRGLPGLRDPDRFEAWQFRLLVRICRDHARRAWRNHVVEIPIPSDHEPSMSGPQAVVDDRDQLERGLSRLSDDHRAVLVVTYYLDLSPADAAAALGVPVGTMKSRLSRAIAALRAAIDADARVAIQPMEPMS